MDEQTTTKDLTPYVEAALRGASVNSQAKLAGVAQATLRRLVISHPDYLKAKKEGTVRSRPTYNTAELRRAPHVMAVMQGEPVAEVANRFGMTDDVVRAHVHRAFPGSSRAVLSAGTARQNSAQTPPAAPFRDISSTAGSKSGSTQVKPLGDYESRTTLTDSNNSKQPESHDTSSTYQGMLTHQLQLLPMISWATARDWEPGASEIPQDQILGWRAAARPSSPHSYVLTVEDQAMTAPPGSLSFPQGCQIFVDAGRRDEAAAGKRVVARLASSGQLVFRTMQADPVTGKRWLEPLNQLFGVITEPFQVVGLVFGKWEDVDA